jgi:hypothetical protein
MVNQPLAPRKPRLSVTATLDHTAEKPRVFPPPGVEPEMWASEYWPVASRFRESTAESIAVAYNEGYDPDAVYVCPLFDPSTYQALLDTPGMNEDELINRLIQRRKEQRANQRMDVPYPRSDFTTEGPFTTINDLRRHMAENSGREKVWSDKGRIPVPSEWQDLPKSQLFRRVGQWRDETWIEHMATRGIRLGRCPHCRLIVRTDTHQCFVTEASKTEYVGGIPVRQRLEVGSSGAKVTQRRLTVPDLQRMEANQRKAEQRIADLGLAVPSNLHQPEYINPETSEYRPWMADSPNPEEEVAEEVVDMEALTTATLPQALTRSPFSATIPLSNSTVILGVIPPHATQHPPEAIEVEPMEDGEVDDYRNHDNGDTPSASSSNQQGGNTHVFSIRLTPGTDVNKVQKWLSQPRHTQHPPWESRST